MEKVWTLKDGSKRFTYSQDGFKQILKIYAAYNYALDVNLNLELRIDRLELIVDIMDKEVEECKDVLDESKHHVNVLNKQRIEDFKYFKKQEKKDQLKIILISTGTGVVALAAGIVIGFLAIR